MSTITSQLHCETIAERDALRTRVAALERSIAELVVVLSAVDLRDFGKWCMKRDAAVAAACKAAAGEAMKVIS